ncbi:hypothetical protein [Geothrix sp. 21YS21S-2]|uniref:hypothetical protein n=1 Tax=Geothrix sp. 21YS21S-2 TaxID=3068893 RepID=UPI0027BA9FF6|nr:hypothetical protein [Geothrix sp. 21YS21S-2]
MMPYDEQMVTEIEKRTIQEILKTRTIDSCSPAFIKRACAYFPEIQPSTKPRKGRPAKTPFITEVGQYLWLKWNLNKTDANRDDFILYLCRLIYGMMARMTKWGDLYEDCFNNLVVSGIKNIGKYDPKRVIGQDKDGIDVYATVYTYFYMRFKFDLQGMNQKLTDHAVHTGTMDEWLLQSDPDDLIYEETYDPDGREDPYSMPDDHSGE